MARFLTRNHSGIIHLHTNTHVPVYLHLTKVFTLERPICVGLLVCDYLFVLVEKHGF